MTSLTGLKNIDSNSINLNGNDLQTSLDNIPVSSFKYDANLDIKDVALVASNHSIDMISEASYFLQMDNIINRNNQTHNIGFFLKAPITTNYATSNMKDVFRINKKNTSGNIYDNDKWEGYINEDKIITSASTDTLTNKTINADGTGNSIINIDNNNIKNGANIEQSKILNLSTDLSNKQDTLTFSNVQDNNGNPSSTAQINNYLAVNYQPKIDVTGFVSGDKNKLNGIANNANNFSISSGDITNDMLSGSIAQSKILNLSTDLGNKQNTISSGDITNDMLSGSIAQSKILNLSTDLGNKQDNLTFNGPPSNNNNPSTSAQIKAYTENNFQPKNSLVYNATTNKLGVDITDAFRKFDMGHIRAGLGYNLNLDNNQGIYWHTSGFDYSIARESGAWGSTRELAIRWSTGIRFSVDSTRTISGNVGYSNNSDNRLKHNEESITGALSTIKKLKVYKYYKTGSIYDPSGNEYGSDYNLSEEELKTIPTCQEVGVIAQDLLLIDELKFVVKENGLDSSGNQKPYSVGYENIHNILIQAVQELAQQLDEVKLELKEIKNLL